jgi:hypothetical protein
MEEFIHRLTETDEGRQGGAIGHDVITFVRSERGA